MQLNFPNTQTAEEPRTLANAAVWACGFRPFFLGGAALAALLIGAWLVVFFGGHAMGGPAGAVGWHAHEMLFGFVAAIIAGFLLTAVPKWTRTKTITGPKLIILFTLWLAGRAGLAMAGLIPYAAVAAVDVLFLPALATAIAVPIIRARTPRNLGFIPLLFGLATANAIFHLAHLGVVEAHLASLALDAALAIIVVIVAIIGGRVIPFFTVNKVGYGTVERRRPVDIAAIILSVAWLFSFIFWPTATVTGALALGAGAANLGRMYGWATLKTKKVPLLWVLHAGYFFVGAGLVLYGLSVFQLFDVPRSAALHGLTAGAMGILCLGMMARVSLGHTGRQLQAHPIMTVAFALVVLAATIRTFVPWLAPEFYGPSITISGVLWTAAWVLFLIIYVPILLSPRADGRPG